MTLIIISISAFFTAFITVYSGFGLGTLLMPVIAIFFPVPIAIAITAIVHMLNNLFRLILLWKHINWNVTLRFGLPAAFAAIPGAILLLLLSRLNPLLSYQFLHLHATITPVKIVTAILLILFGTMELIKPQHNSFFKMKWLSAGGLISGFFGGLSGQQGAFRTPFLLHADLSKMQFISTNASIAVLVDITRIFIYLTSFSAVIEAGINKWFIIISVAAAFAGSLSGISLLKKVSFGFIQILIIILLYFLAFLLLLGII